MKNKLIIGLFASFLCLGSGFLLISKSSVVSAEDSNPTMEEIAEESTKQASLASGNLSSLNCNFTPSNCDSATGVAYLGKVDYKFYGEVSGQGFVLGKNHTSNPPIEFELTVGGYANYFSPSDRYTLKNSSSQEVLSTYIPEIHYGEVLIFKSKNGLYGYYNSTGNRYVTNAFSSDSFSLVAGMSIETKKAKTFTFTPDGDDLKRGVTYYFVFVRQLTYQEWIGTSVKTQIEYYGISVLNNVPIGSYSLGKFAQRSFSLSGNYSSRCSNSSYSSFPEYGSLSYYNTSKLDVRPQLVGQVKTGEGTYVYKGTSNPIVRASSIGGQVLKSENSSSYHQPVNMNATYINNVNVGVRVGNGGVLLEKLVGETWVADGFYTNVSSKKSTDQYFDFELYKEDFLSGMKYRLTYQTQYEYYHKEFVGWWIFGHDEITHKYYSYTFQYIFSLIDSSKANEQSFVVENGVGSSSSEVEFTPENPLLDQFYTLGENGVSFSNLTVDFLGNTQNKLYYSLNGKPQVFAYGENGLYMFEEEGCYDFKIVSPVGDYSTRRLYIMDIGSDNAYSKFFGDGFVDSSKRIYTTDNSLPTYQVGSKIHINKVENLPGIYGNIYYINAGNPEIIKTFKGVKDGFEMELNKCGTYFADLYSNDQNCTGQIIHYEIRFIVSDQSETYRPSVNKNILYTQSKLSNYVTKVYSFKVKSLGEGNFIYVFPMNDAGYADCLNFTANFEYRKVDLVNNKYVYNGVTYENSVDGKTKLNDAIYASAEDLVSVTYFDNSQPLPYLDEQVIEDIDGVYLDYDAYVVSDENVRKTLLANQPLLNGFMFTQVGEYESSSVKVIDPNGVEIAIPYDTLVDELVTMTGRYKIIETNWAGTTEYYANYIAKDDNTAKLHLKFYFNGDSVESYIDITHNGSIPTTAFVIVDGNDANDSQTIVKIVSDSETRFYLLSEVNNLDIYNGVDSSYDIFIINRLGYMYAFNVRFNKSKGNPNILAEKLLRENNYRTIDFSQPVDDVLTSTPKGLETKYIIIIAASSGVVAGVGAFFLIRFIIRRRRGI